MLAMAPSLQRPVGVGDDAVGVDLQFDAEALAVGAGAVRRVEGKGARLDLGDADAVLGAGEVLGEVDVAAVLFRPLRIGQQVERDVALRRT